MKKIALIAWIALIGNSTLFADQADAAAPSSSDAVKNGNWENAVFSITALFTAAAAIFVVSINDGSSGASH